MSATGDGDDKREAPKATADEAMAALAALATSLSEGTGKALLDLVRETSHLSVETALDADKKVAGMLGGFIDAQAKEIKTLRAKVTRLERISVELIARGRDGRRK